MTAPEADRPPAAPNGSAKPTDGAPADASRADSSRPAEAAPASRPLSPAAQRALDEARARRAEIDARARALAARPEVDGRGGKEPVRFGDWEVKGIATDF